MKKNRLYECEMDACSNTVSIRSTLKKGDHKGKKVCPYCYSKFNKITKQTTKNKEQRQEERAGLPVFFQYHISKVKSCENCGVPIRNPGVSNIAHILPKSKFKSINSALDNALYLCLGCHTKYDSSWAKAMSMKVWDLAVSRYNKFKNLIKEKSLILENFEK